MAENATSNQRTRHIDAKHRFLIDLTEEGFLDVVLTNLANNTSDGLSKNVSKEVYQRHTPRKFIARLGLWQVRTTPISYPLPPCLPHTRQDRGQTEISGHKSQ